MLKVKHELFVYLRLQILFDTSFKIALSRIMVRTSEPLHIVEFIIATVRRAIQTIKTSSTDSIWLPNINGIRKTRLTGFVIIILLIICCGIKNHHFVGKYK